MSLVEELLGCSLLQIDRSYWAVRLDTGEWVCEARIKTDLYKGVERNFDWSNDLVANGEVLKIVELWLLCPPSQTSPAGNTARLVITEPGTAFQFKIATMDGLLVTEKHMQAHIIGRVTNKETGDCECFAWDEVEQGLITPETLIYDKTVGGPKRDGNGNFIFAGKNNVYNFHGWREDMADPGRIHFDTVGLRL